MIGVEQVYILQPLNAAPSGGYKYSHNKDQNTWWHILVMQLFLACEEMKNEFVFKIYIH